MHNFKLTIAYDGTAYSGWQVQPNGLSIQEVIQDKISTILQKQVVLIGSGRTDAGVHALGQVAHFHHSSSIDLYRFFGSLNSLLPADIRVKEIIEVPLEFHAQHRAVSKIYHYHLCLETVQNPFKRLYSVHVRERIDLNVFRDASKIFLGTHDFTSFANEAHKGSAAKDAIRTLHRLDIIEEAGGIRLEFEGDGFLYKMVRNIVGTLLETAAGKYSIEDISTSLAAKDRRQTGKTAPPHGLFLVQVNYPECPLECQKK